MSKIIAICNQKGGVGKSTTTYHLARALVETGKSVLIVDTDPQGNITTALSADPLPDNTICLADVLSKRTHTKLLEIIVPTIWENVDLAPTVGDTLGFVRDELLLTGPGREDRLRSAFDQVRNIYDYILIDCPPSLDLLLLNAITAANQALIITHPKQWSTDGIANLLNTIRDVKKYYNPSIEISGVLINQAELTTTSAKYWIDEIKTAGDTLGFRSLETVVPKRTAIADAIETRTSLYQLPAGKKDNLAEIYQNILKELSTNK